MEQSVVIKEEREMMARMGECRGYIRELMKKL